MKKLKWLRILNIFVALGFLAVAISVALYISPIPALNGNETLAEVHETVGKILFVLIILHVILNWNWIQTQYLKKKKQVPNQTPTPKPAAKSTSKSLPKAKLDSSFKKSR